MNKDAIALIIASKEYRVYDTENFIPNLSARYVTILLLD